MKSEAINIDRYIGHAPGERFDFIYENFSVIRNLLTDYREDLIRDVMEQKAYNRRERQGDLGVRVQVSVLGNPTQNQAISHMTIEEAIKSGVMDEEFFEDTDDRDELIRKVTCYHAVYRDVDTFTSKLSTLTLKDQKIIKPYLKGDKSLCDLADDMGIEYRSAIKHIHRIKKRLSEKVEPKLVMVDGGK